MHDRVFEPEYIEVELWVARCGVCGTKWTYREPSRFNPYPHGAFCPACQDRKAMSSGVLHFKPQVRSVRSLAP